MATDKTTLQQLAPAQNNQETRLNEIAESLSAAGLFSKRHAVTSGLTWGYYGGRYNGVSVDDGTVTLTNTATNYVVVHRTTGAVSVSTTNTNWNNNTTYARLYQLTVAGGVVTAVLDGRLDTGGLLNGGGGGGGGSVAGSDKQVQYNNSGAFGAEAGFEYDAATNTLTLPHIVLGTGGTRDANIPASDDSHVVEIVVDPTLEAGGTGVGLQFMRWSAYGSVSGVYGGNFHFARMGGTKASPTQTLNGMTFMSFGLRGRDNASTNTPSQASFAFVATADWTSSSRPGKFVFGCTPSGSTTRADTFQIDGAGTDVLVGTAKQGGVDLGTKELLQNSHSADYTLVLADAGKHQLHPSSDANTRTFTIPANSSVAYPIGTSLTFINETSQVLSIAITTDTLTLANSTTTGTRSLAQNGIATALKITSTKWIISGAGLT